LDRHLHIVTHDVPWPADFGGVVDLFYKIKTLHQLGIKIHLHCYTSKRAEQPMLNRYCESVDYYPRKKNLSILPYSIPYIVMSRCDENLLVNLEKDNYPILLEGIHCTYHLFKGKLNDRKVLVRLHNVEYRYYKNLYSAESGILKKMYYFIESILLKKYEKKLAQTATFLTVSKTDETLYKNVFQAQHLHFLPVFIPWSQINSKVGSGNFCLYHGNLAVNENEKAVIWLLEEIFSKINIPFVVAGKNPSSALKKAAHQQLNTCLVENPSEFELDDLIRKAQVNILPSYNSTGVKLKLINALFNGRHCLVNKAAAEGTAVEDACISAEDAKEFSNEILRLFEKPFTEEDILKRKQILGELYDNNKNAETLITLLY